VKLDVKYRNLTELRRIRKNGPPLAIRKTNWAQWNWRNKRNSKRLSFCIIRMSDGFNFWEKIYTRSTKNYSMVSWQRMSNWWSVIEKVETQERNCCRSIHILHYLRAHQRSVKVSQSQEQAKDLIFFFIIASTKLVRREQTISPSCTAKYIIWCSWSIFNSSNTNSTAFLNTKTDWNDLIHFS
jgi:hypothetical protein